MSQLSAGALLAVQMCECAAVSVVQRIEGLTKSKRGWSGGKRERLLGGRKILICSLDNRSTSAVFTIRSHVSVGRFRASSEAPQN